MAGILGRRAEAERLVGRCILDVRRPEQQFSLYRDDSAICTLNRTGILVSPDPDLVTLLRASLRFAEITDGAFDPTVQPLWQLMQIISVPIELTRKGHRSRGWRQRWQRWGRRNLLVSEDRIALTRRGAAITLNGIAQGYVTDRVVEMLRSAGLSTTLVNMGEIRAIGTGPEGKPWRVGLADPDRPGALTETIDLVDRASRRQPVPDSGSTPTAGSRICSIPQREAVPCAIARSASSRLPQRRPMRSRPRSA